jgi:hypothetical protein
MVFGGVPMRFYRMKTVKLARGIGIFFSHWQLRQARSSDPGFAGEDGFSGPRHAE